MHNGLRISRPSCHIYWDLGSAQEIPGTPAGLAEGGSFPLSQTIVDTGPQQLQAPPYEGRPSKGHAAVFPAALPSGTCESENAELVPLLVPKSGAPVSTTPFVASATSANLPAPSTGDQLGRNVSVPAKPKLKVPDPAGTLAEDQFHPTLQQNVAGILATFKEFREGVMENFKSQEESKKGMMENFNSKDLKEFKKGAVEIFKSQEEFRDGVMKNFESLEARLRSLASDIQIMRR